MSKKMIIKGVGKMFTRKIVDGIPTNDILDCGTLQALRFDFATELGDIYGGDGLFPIDQILQSKNVNVTATEAQFDLNMMPTLMGGGIEELASGDGGYRWILGEYHAVPTGAEVSLKVTGQDFITTTESDGVSAGTEGIPADAIIVINKLTGESMEILDYSDVDEPAQGEFMVNIASGSEPVKIKLPSGMENGEISVHYKMQSDVTQYDIKIEDMPFPISVVHQGSFVQRNGSKQGIEVELFSCIASGTLSIDMQRRTASAHELTLKLLDPDRVDGRVGRVKRFSL